MIELLKLRKRQCIKVPQTKFYTHTGKGIISVIGKWFNCFKIKKVSYIDSMFLMKAPAGKKKMKNMGTKINPNGPLTCKIILDCVIW